MATTISYDRPTFTTTRPDYRHDYRPDFTISGDRNTYYTQQQGQSTGKTLAIVALLPVGGILLGLAGLTLVGTLIGLAVATPLFIIFSPIIVPAILTIGLAVASFLTSGTFGLTGLSSLSYLFNMVRQSAGSVPEALQDVGDYAGQKTKEFGQKIQDTAHDVGEYTGQKTKEFGQRVQNTSHEIGEQGQVHGQAGVNVQVGGKEGRKGGGGGDHRA